VDGGVVTETPVRRLLESERVRFLIVGGLNTAVGYALFVALQLAAGDELGYLGVLLISHVISVLFAFVMHRRIVFRVQGNVLVDLVRFWSVYATTIAVNAAALPLLVEVAGLPVIAAQTVFLVVSVAATYVAHKRFSFRR
jgi:putative flippase GtrA